MKNLKTTLLEEIEDIRDRTMFNAFYFKGHALKRHILTDEQLRQAIWDAPRPYDECDIVMVTRFFDETIARNLIADTLTQNIDEIEKWIISDSDENYAAIATFDKPTGDGLVKNTDWSKPIQVHGVCVVVRKDSSNICNHFGILTAYPIRVMEDVDEIYEAIDKYIEKKSVKE